MEYFPYTYLIGSVDNWICWVPKKRNALYYQQDIEGLNNLSCLLFSFSHVHTSLTKKQ